MTRKSLLNVLLSLAVIGGLLSLDVLREALRPGRASYYLYRMLAAARNTDLNQEDRHASTAGYYEALLEQPSRPATSGRLVSGLLQKPGGEVTAPFRRRTDFLLYELKPNLNQPYRGGWLITNSHGMADREYSVAKPRNTRRIAMLGDSLVEGATAPFGHCFEALLETRLNQPDARPPGTRVEILNFGAGGYRTTQLVEVAVERAPAFDPDAYIVALTDVSIFTYWGSHVAELVQAEADLKYAYLRHLVVSAGLKRTDSYSQFHKRLAPYRMQTLRWALEMLRNHARSTSKPLLVILVPTVDDPIALNQRFAPVRDLLEELEIPYIDVLDTFSAVDDLEPLRAARGDIHPERVGHQMIFQNLYAKLAARPELMAALTGAQKSAGRKVTSAAGLKR